MKSFFSTNFDMLLLRGLLMVLSVMALSSTTASAGQKYYAYTYNITVVVRDAGGEVVGSGVVAVQESSFNGARLPPRMCGESTPVRLHNGTVLFVMLGGPVQSPTPGRAQWRGAPTQILLERLGLPKEWGQFDESGILALPSIKTPVRLDANEMPQFRAFRDLANPTSVQLIDPSRPPAWLGADVKIESVTVSVTDEKPTRNRLPSILKWFDEVREFLDGSKFGQAVQQIHSREFSECRKF